MKYIFFLIVFFFSCKKTKEKATLFDDDDKIIIIQDTIKNKPKSIKICAENFKSHLTPLKGLVTSKKIIYYDNINENRLYNNLPNIFNSLFRTESINCILPSSASPYFSFELFYEKSIKAENIYDNLISFNKNYKNADDIQGYYHDFFKRGLVFILDKKNNKITIIDFNPFADNSIPKKIRQYFLKHKNEYDNVFMTTGIRAIEEFIKEKQ